MAGTQEMATVNYDQTPSILKAHQFERQGCPIHYWLGGPEERPLIVLMHGATMDHRMFNPQIEALAARFRVLVWDARGHGLSQPIGDGFSLEGCAEDMLAILDHLGVEAAIVAGQSLGGYVAQHIYIAAPERVKAMIVIGATPLAKAYGKLDMWSLKLTMPLFSVWPYGHFTQTLANNTAVTQPVRDYALQASRQINRDDFLTIWKAVTLAIDGRGRELTIDVPLLLLHGNRDDVGAIKRDMPVWAESEPMVTYKIIPDAGHNANQDNPLETNKVLLDFLSDY